MCKIKLTTFNAIIIFVIINVSLSDFVSNETRRIINGYAVTTDKRYVVYLLKAPESKVNYTAWLCGGAIINPLHILTSASCILDVDLIYVVAGYRKYVNAKKIQEDECIMKTFRRIVYTCYSSELKTKYLYEKSEYWNFGDIAVARVDRAFDFHDMGYYKYCSYPPAAIRVHVYKRYYSNELHVLTFGWGHRSHYRPDGVDVDLNEKWLRYSSGKTMNVEVCYDDVVSPLSLKYLKNHLKKFFICVNEPSKMDENGHMADNLDMIDCGEGNKTRRAISHRDCFLRKLEMLRASDPHLIKSVGGICQNDHGGPLVAFIGGHETVIGVSTAFVVTKTMHCRPPFMYTGTRCLGKVIQCTLFPNRYRRSGTCNGYSRKRGILERNITWPGAFEGTDVNNSTPVPTDLLNKTEA